MMRDWLLANAFFAALAIVAAALLCAAFILVRLAGLDADLERQVLGWFAICSLVASGLIARYALRRIERR